MVAIKYAYKGNGQVKPYVEQITHIHTKKVDFSQFSLRFKELIHPVIRMSNNLKGNRHTTNNNRH